MSSSKRNIFFGFAAVAVVLVAVLAIWRPPALRNEDASGAIGAVQKHHEPQIAQQDVILGDEATKQEQDVLYADFLNDAAKLQDISNDINSRQASRAQSRLAEQSDALQARYARSASRFAEAASRIAARENNQKLAADVSELSQKLSAKLNAADMEAVNAKVAAITAAAGARSESRINFAAKSLNEAVDAMQSRNAVAAAKLSEAADNLDARASGSRLSDISEYLQAITMESRAVGAAQSKLAANKLAEASSDLSSHSVDMESRAVNNMASRLNEQAEMGSKLAAMNAQIENANRFAASKASVMAARTDNISAAVAGVRAAYARANADYAARTASAISLNMSSLQNYLSSRPQAAARLDAKLEARAAGNRATMARSVASMRELAARPDLASKVDQRVLGNADALQSKLSAKSN